MTDLTDKNRYFMNQDKPQVIFLDAVGTLFGVKGGVGEVYAEIAKKFDVECESEKINQAFNLSFKASSPLAFNRCSQREVYNLEFEWWRNILDQTFTQLEVRDKFTNFDDFFLEVYLYFATAQPWEVYADTLASLKKWQSQDIELGIISNFDTRLYKVLELLGLRKYFLSITISATAGVAKPHPKIFTIALEKHGCQPENCWYIGDSIKEDYFGAKSLGIKSFLITR